MSTTNHAASDLELVELARTGHSDAVGELWSRHYPMTVRVAQRWARRPADAEDVAAEAFSRMLAAIADGGGPSGSVPGYLTTAVRNLVINAAKRHESANVSVAEPELFAAPTSPRSNPVADRAELSLVREAFAALPTRWRIVLWRTSVDHDTNRQLATDMGLTANAVAALAVRARAGFRTAYLQAHVSRGAVARDCQPYLPLLAGLVQGAKPSPDLSAHLDGCERCRERVGELFDVERRFGALILPGVLVAVWVRVRSLLTKPSAAAVKGLAAASALVVAGGAAVAATGSADPGPAAPTRVAVVQAAPVPVQSPGERRQPVAPTDLPPTTRAPRSVPEPPSTPAPRHEPTRPKRPHPVVDPAPKAAAPPPPAPEPVPRAPKGRVAVIELSVGVVTPRGPERPPKPIPPDTCHPSDGLDPSGCVDPATPRQEPRANI